MNDHHTAIAREVRAEAGTGIEEVDLSIPRELEVAIAARQRQVLRNSAVLAQINLSLARRRDAAEEVRLQSHQLDRFSRDIAEIDRLYPEAKAKMAEFDLPPNAQRSPAPS